jgi:hypothetical protein
MGTAKAERKRKLLAIDRWTRASFSASSQSTG